MSGYMTKDLFEAAWLHSQDVSLIKLQPDYKYSWFVFQNKEACQELSSAYWSKKATGNIKQFVDSLKTLKDLVFSQSRNKYERKIHQSY